MSVLDSLALLLTHGAKSATEFETSTARMRVGTAETKLQVGLTAAAYNGAHKAERKALAQERQGKRTEKG